MLRIFILVILFFTFSSMSHGKVFDKKKCEEILKKYDVSYQSWNNILNRYLKEREKLKDKDKKEINRMQNKAIYKLLRFKKRSKLDDKSINIKNKARASLLDTE